MFSARPLRKAKRAPDCCKKASVVTLLAATLSNSRTAAPGSAASFSATATFYCWCSSRAHMEIEA